VGATPLAICDAPAAVPQSHDVALVPAPSIPGEYSQTPDAAAIVPLDGTARAAALGTRFWFNGT